jgi:hypothetical protein
MTSNGQPCSKLYDPFLSQAMGSELKALRV